MTTPVRIGAVMYDPKVAVIWEIISDFFSEHECPIEVIFYSTYELQVEALLEGHFDIAWNSPLAWVDTQRRSGGRCRAIAMRDTDQDRITYIVVKSDSGMTSLDDLRGKTVAVGTKDSPQATLIPLAFLQSHDLEPVRDFQVRRFDVLVGKHGDHIGGEKDAFHCLERGEADASTMLDLNWETWTHDGTIDPTRCTILAKTDLFDHCSFTVRSDFPEEIESQWLDVLFSMSYDNPEHRNMMDMEGLKAWVPGRTTGYGPLTDAVERLRFFDQGQ